MGLENYRRTVSEAKRAAILRAGSEVFLRDGFSRAPVAEIARNADVSTATLYKHFESKEVLFVAVVRDTLANVQDYTDIVAASNDVRDIFLTLAHSYLTIQFEHRSNDLMRIVIGEASSNPALAKEIASFLTQRRSVRLISMLDRLVARGLLRPHDTALGAAFLAGMIKEIFVWPALFDPSFRIPADADETIGAIAELYLARYGAGTDSKGIAG